MEISVDTLTLFFVGLVLLDVWAYYSQLAYLKNNGLESLLRTLNSGLPYLFMAYAAYMVNYEDKRIYVFLISAAAWTTVLVNRVLTESNYRNDDEPIGAEEGGWRDVSYYVARPLAAASLFALPYVFLKTT